MKEINITSNKGKDKKIDIIELLRFYSTKWKAILISVIIFMILGGIYAYTKSPVYEVQANVLITDNDTKSDFLRSFSMADMFGGKSSVDDEIAIMYSHSLFSEIVKKFQLNKTYIVKENFLKKKLKYDNTPVEIVIPPMFSDTVSEPVIFKLTATKDGKVDIKLKKGRFSTIAETSGKTFPAKFDTPYGDFVFQKKDAFYEEGKPLNITIVVNNYNQATENLQDDIKCSIPNKKARVITISLNSTNVPFAEKIVNALVEGYNERGIEENRVKNQITADFIETRLGSIAEELNAAEREVEAYKVDNNFVDLVADAQYIFTKKGTIDEALVTAETEYEILEMTRELMNDPNHRYDLIPTPYGAEAAVDAIAEYNKLILERMKLVNNAKTNNNAALRTISSQLDAMRENINATLDRSLASARVKLHDLREQMNESDSRLGKMPKQEREYLNIKRQQLVKENLYIFLLTQREETNLRIANAIPKGMIIDKAYPLSAQVNLSKVQIYILFFILGLLAVPGWLYLRDLFRNKFSTKSELSDLTTLPIVGEIVKDKSGEKIVIGEQFGISSESFRMFRAKLQFLLSNDNDQIIQITSMTSGAGKTFVATNLAACIAESGKKVVVVDMDIRNPHVANYLDIHTDTGLSQYIIDKNIKLEDLVAKAPGIRNLDVVTAGTIPPNPGELLASPRIKELLTELRKHYDYIVIDTSPMNHMSELAMLSNMANATLIVCRANFTTFDDVANINEFVTEYGMRRVSLILNGTKEKGYNYPRQ